MKKVLFAAIAVCGFAFANAQSSQTVNTPINLNIQETVFIGSQDGGTPFTATFNEPGHFGTYRSMGMKSFYILSTNAGTYNVSFNRGDIPTAVGLRYSITDWTAGPMVSNQDIATPASGTFYYMAGSDQGVGENGFETYVSLEANVPWGVMAGNYTGTMTITATTE